MSNILILDPNVIKPFNEQPRKRFKNIGKLLASIKEIGQTTPVVVTPYDEEPQYQYKLVDGERRQRACIEGNISIKAVLDEEGRSETVIDRFIRSLSANFCRQDHDCIEISDAVQTLRRYGKTNEQICVIFGKSITWVMQHASLANLHPSIRDQLKSEERKRKTRKKGRITFSLALLLVILRPEEQLKVAEHISKNQLSIAAARTYVQAFNTDVELKKLLRPGTRIGKPVSPAQRLASLEAALETFVDTLGKYQRAEYLESVLTVVDKTRLDKIVVNLGKINCGVTGLVRCLQKQI